MSMISEQIDELEMAKHSVLDRDTIDKLLNDAITTIKELSTKIASESMERSDRYYNGRWIPCSRSTPNDGKEVLVTAVSDDSKQIFVSTAWFKDGRWSWLDIDDTDNFDIIAWQPLPEPYKEANNETD